MVVGEAVVSPPDAPPVPDADIGISPAQSTDSDQGGREASEGTGASDVNIDAPAPGDLSDHISGGLTMPGMTVTSLCPAMTRTLQIAILLQTAGAMVGKITKQTC